MLFICFAFFIFFQLNNQTVGDQILATLFILCGARRKSNIHKYRNCDTANTVYVSVPKNCHMCDKSLKCGILFPCFVFLQPAEGLVLWEQSWHRTAALFFTNMTKLQRCSRSALICVSLTETKKIKIESEGPCRTKWHDPPDLLDGFQIYLTGLANLISHAPRHSDDIPARFLPQSVTKNKQNEAKWIFRVVSLR